MSDRFTTVQGFNMKRLRLGLAMIIAVPCLAVSAPASNAQAWGIVNGWLCHGFAWNRASDGNANFASVVTSKAAASDCVNPRVRARRANGTYTAWVHGGVGALAVGADWTQPAAESDFIGGGHGIFNPYTPIGSGSWLNATT